MEKIFDFAEQLNLAYDRLMEKNLKTRRFKHRDLLPIISRLNENPVFDITREGFSTEGREIFLIRIGQGKKKVFLWSQMHGDEPTATMALFDIFNFFAQTKEFSFEKESILQNLEIYFIPMVNPDGAELFKRRNSMDIDLNRDAARLEAIETRLLKNVRDRINPEYGFNLHDQETYYTAGATAFPATISFLAPSYNGVKDINEGRLKSIGQIVLMERVLQKYIPNCIGRYSDDFMPTAFGDNMQLWGTSTILIESGGYYNDPEKQNVRKMNFLAILSSLYGIANEWPGSFELMEYFRIPENKKEKLFDLLVRKAMLEKNGKKYKIDFGIRNQETNSPDFCSFTTRACIADVGDLTYYYGYREIDASGLYIRDLELNQFKELLMGTQADFCLVDDNNKLVYRFENGIISD